mmetsp:Transcript_25266/g.37267  ORF Transcript_25266/g.37267 Transcript_25266/m.37267 type:complete len:365 (-) Transcript_25266:235-1329(-)
MLFKAGLLVAFAVADLHVWAFSPSSPSLSSRVSSFYTSTSSCTTQNIQLFSRVKTRFDGDGEQQLQTFDPLGFSDDADYYGHEFSSSSPIVSSKAAVAAPILALSTIVIDPESSYAAATSSLSTGDFNPDNFRPVCGASDSFYRFLQGSTRAVVGDENFSEYGPLIAGGLLRIRLELCVVESFFNEAVGPFIKENGLNWILPIHESVETFLAGTIFALATTFILVGSTKLVQIIAFYGDLLVGGPCRLIGGFFFDRARGEPVTLDVSFFGFFKTRLVGPPVDFKEEEIKKVTGQTKLVDFDKVKPAEIPLIVFSGGVKLVGEASKVFREFIEALDLFVGRYLVLLASGYIILKFVHFKIFPDFP